MPFDPIDYPELIFATAGPIGVDMDVIAETLDACLKEVEYRLITVKLTEEMKRFSANVIPTPENTFNEYHYKMDYANALRRSFQLPDMLARIGLDAIRTRRSHITGKGRSPVPSQAYLLSQLKRPEEVDLLRKVYGRQFILISAYAPEHARHDRLARKLRTRVSTNISEAELNFLVDKLIERDGSEEDRHYGQSLRDTFHLGDVFVHGIDPVSMRATLQRFVQVLFGRNDITPSKDEYGMYAAKSASLRSADLSRQVGAAIFSSRGEIICLGCNEVPKAGGGTYWDLEHPDHRDIKKGYDPNEERRREIVRDLIERMRGGGFLSEKALTIGNDAAIVDCLVATHDDSEGVLTRSRIMDLTEYGRIVHAEMSAVCDAARIGRSIKGSVLYCTTFPCHNCTKHIIAAGIKKVVFLEPYPKSQAKLLHGDEIEIEEESESGRVSFVPFLGISPYRYRDLFQKGRRKDSHGMAERWCRKVPQPMLDVVFPSYVDNEAWALLPALGKIDDYTTEIAHHDSPEEKPGNQNLAGGGSEPPVST